MGQGSFKRRTLFVTLLLAGLGAFLSATVFVLFTASFFRECLNQFEQTRMWDVPSEAIQSSPDLLENPDARVALLAKIEALNPSVSAYLIDRTGEVLDRRTLQRTGERVSLEPIFRALVPRLPLFPLLGDDPVTAGHRSVFSVAPLPGEGGYLYLLSRTSWFEGYVGLFRLLRELQFGLLVTVTIAFALSAILLRKLFGTLFRITQLVESYRAGDLTAHFESTQDDQISRVGRLLSERAFEAMSQKTAVENAQKRRTRLFAQLVHDLRTPLASLAAALESLTHEKIRKLPSTVRQLDDATRCAVQSYRDLGQSLGSLQNEIAFSAKSALRSVSLNKIASGVVDRLGPIARSEEILLTYQSIGNKRAVIGNANLLDRALTNLITNALRHTLAGGSVAVVIEYTPEFVFCRVSDSGVGIPADDVPRIFLAQFRAKNSAPGGAGFGLAFVREVVDLHDATIEVASEVGKGSTFTVGFPVRVSPSGVVTDPTVSIATMESRTQSRVSASLAAADREYIVPGRVAYAFGAMILASCPTRPEYAAPAIRFGVPSALLLVAFIMHRFVSRQRPKLDPVSDRMILGASILIASELAFFAYHGATPLLVFWFGLYGSFMADAILRARSRAVRMMLVIIELTGLFLWWSESSRTVLSVAFFICGALFHLAVRDLLYGERSRELLSKLVAYYGCIAFGVGGVLLFRTTLITAQNVREGSPAWNDSSVTVLHDLLANELQAPEGRVDKTVLLQRLVPNLELNLEPAPGTTMLTTPNRFEELPLLVVSLHNPEQQLRVERYSHFTEILLRQIWQRPLFILLLLLLLTVTVVCSAINRIGGPRLQLIMKELLDTVRVFEPNYSSPTMVASSNPVIAVLNSMGEELRDDMQRIVDEERKTKELIDATRREIEQMVSGLGDVLSNLTIQTGDGSSILSDEILARARGLVAGEDQLIDALFTLVRYGQGQLVAANDERFVPAESLGSAVMELGTYSRARSISVRQHHEENELMVNGCEGVVDSICRSLLQGAMSAAGSNGRVFLESAAYTEGVRLGVRATTDSREAPLVPLGFIVAQNLAAFGSIEVSWTSNSSGELALSCKIPEKIQSQNTRSVQTEAVRIDAVR